MTQRKTTPKASLTSKRIKSTQNKTVAKYYSVQVLLEVGEFSVAKIVDWFNGFAKDLVDDDAAIRWVIQADTITADKFNAEFAK